MGVTLYADNVKMPMEMIMGYVQIVIPQIIVHIMEVIVMTPVHQ